MVSLDQRVWSSFGRMLLLSQQVGGRPSVAPDVPCAHGAPGEREWPRVAEPRALAKLYGLDEVISGEVSVYHHGKGCF